MNIFIFRTKYLLTSLFTISIILNLMGCFATTNYYTGKTLANKKMMLTGGFDNIIVHNYKGDFYPQDEIMIFPSVSLSRGFPKRFEAGLRWYFLKTFEGSVRWQVNPNNFNAFDLSTNLHYGTYNFFTNYFKYGLTLSKQLNQVEPYLSYYQYANGNITKPLDSDWDSFYNKNRVFSIGLSHSVKNWGYIVPEINFQVIGNDFKNTITFYSIGFRFDFHLK